jgi:hypothetical protein
MRKKGVRSCPTSVTKKWQKLIRTSVSLTEVPADDPCTTRHKSPNTAAPVGQNLGKNKGKRQLPEQLLALILHPRPNSRLLLPPREKMKHPRQRERIVHTVTLG